MVLTEELILQHGRNSPHKGIVENPTLSVTTANKLCGDVIKMDIIVDQDKITDIAFSGEGCLISQAAASLLINKIIRIKKITKVKKFNKGTVLNLLGTPLTLSRIRCALLSLETLQKALENY